MLELKYFNEFNDLPDKSIQGKAFHSLTRRYSYAIPTETALREIIKYSPIIEIGAGLGYWASLITKLKGDIISVDNFSWFKKNIYSLEKTHYKIINGDHSCVKKHKDRTLFICWPPPDDNMAYKCLKNYKGNYFLYIGEDYPGCTANEKFYLLLKNSFKLIKKIELPNWNGFNSHLKVYKRLGN